MVIGTDYISSNKSNYHTIMDPEFEDYQRSVIILIGTTDMLKEDCALHYSSVPGGDSIFPRGT